MHRHFLRTVTSPRPCWLRALLLAPLLASLGGSTGLPTSARAQSAAPLSAGPVPEIVPGVLQGYLPDTDQLDSRDFVLPAPADDSARQMLDTAWSKSMLPLRNTARWDLAIRDADLTFPAAADTFSCALGLRIGERETPALYRLLRRSLADLGLATYPSGHTAIGWGWALILSELAPDRAEAILARGRAFGESRTVCNVHWYSDVVAGRVVGAAAVARLQANREFLAAKEAARAEIERTRDQGVSLAHECAAEAAALATPN